MELKCISIASMYHKVCVLHSSLLSLFICVITQSFEKESLISWTICAVCALNITNPLFVRTHHLTTTLMLLSEVPFSHPSTFPVLTLVHMTTGVHYYYLKDRHVQISWTVLVCLWAIQMKLLWFNKEKVALTHPSTGDLIFYANMNFQSFLEIFISESSTIFDRQVRYGHN